MFQWSQGPLATAVTETGLGPTKPAVTRIEITVLGEPIAQGSKRVVPTGAGHRVIESNEHRLRPWRQAIASAALTATNGHEPATGPLALRATFVFARPATHSGTGRNAGLLKPSA